MKEFTVYCTWQMTGHYLINAENEAEARAQVEKMPLPDGDFLDDSFIIDEVDEREIKE